MPPRIVAIAPVFMESYREVRLRALADSPSAFGSTYAREAAFAEDEWMKRVRGLDGVARIGYLALDHEGRACGLGLSFLATGDEGRERFAADVISFWVAPEQRGSGLADQILHALIDWAQSRGAVRVQLMVTSSNDRAIAFYKRCGFVATGRTEPYPNDSTLREMEMERSLAG